MTRAEKQVISKATEEPMLLLKLDLESFASKNNAPQKVIGHYTEYVDLSNKLDVKPFSIPDKVWNKMNPTEQWVPIKNS